MSLVPRPIVTRWIVRDSTPDGQCLPFVTVWEVRPTRIPVLKGFVWRNGEQGLEGWLESIWDMESWRRFGTVPDDDRQCVRVELNG